MVNNRTVKAAAVEKIRKQKAATGAKKKDMRFANILRRRMKEAGASAADVAKMTGLDHRTINYWLRGERGPSYEALMRLTSGLNVDPKVWFEEVEE